MTFEVPEQREQGVDQTEKEKKPLNRKESALLAAERRLLATLPETRQEAEALTTPQIVKTLREFDDTEVREKRAAMNMTGAAASERSEKLWEEIIPRQNFLREVLEERIEAFVVPEEFKIAAEKYLKEVTAAQEYEDWQKLVKAWKELAKSSPLYGVALFFAYADSSINANSRQDKIKEARDQIRKYFESL